MPDFPTKDRLASKRPVSPETIEYTCAAQVPDVGRPGTCPTKSEVELIEVHQLAAWHDEAGAAFPQLSTEPAILLSNGFSLRGQDESLAAVQLSARGEWSNYRRTKIHAGDANWCAAWPTSHGS
jgi:hypothetical protein